MKIDEIEQLVELLEGSNVEEFEMERSGVRIRLRRASHRIASGLEGAAPVDSEQTREPVSLDTKASEMEELPDTDLHTFTAPMVGTFYNAPKPDTDPFVQVGSKVSQGEILCIIEAMKIFNQIESDVEGVIEEVLIETGQPVEYGEPLFRIRTASR